MTRGTIRWATRSTARIERLMGGLTREDHEQAGALFGRVREAEVARHYGDPASEYSAAASAVAVRDRGHRARLLVTGRAPVATLTGVLTGRMPTPPRPSAQGDVRGSAEYSAVLTPKGRVIADLRAMWGPDPDEESLWLDVPAPALGPLLAHLKRYVPPRLAAVEDVSPGSGLLTVMGPEAATVIVEVVFVSDVDAETLQSLEEGEYLVGPEGERVVRSGDVDTPAWDLVTSAEGAIALWGKLLERGTKPVGVGVWDTLRVEAGRPAFGQDMSESTLFSEVGIVDRAVDHSKGCYTGQEVIVRIRDRGHVNKSLRGLKLGDSPAPGADCELFLEGDVVGHVTSAVESPRSQGGIALAYVRREVPAGGVVEVGASGGTKATVRDLMPGWATT